MKNITRIFSILLVLVMAFSCIPAAFAAEADETVIQEDHPCSLTIFKYDFTNAKKDGVWKEDSFISTGWHESYVEDVLGNAIRKGSGAGNSENALGNGTVSTGYAISGVEFTQLKVADIVTYTEPVNDQDSNYNLTTVLYGFDKAKAADLLNAIGLGNGSGAYEAITDTTKLDPSKFYYTSDTLNKAMASALAANSTAVKDALEAYIKGNGGVALNLTDKNGKTSAADLPVGLYLLVETKVPEMVTSTVNPFFVSLPMTTISGNNNSSSPEGGTRWNYDVVVYPKNETGIPTLEKTVREAKADTGKNNGTASITDGFAHTATGSAGDLMEYQFISTLPTITSKATALSVYSFYDSLSEGLTYSKDTGVTVEFFTDKDCTDKVASWTMDSGKFTVAYSEDGRHMTIGVTDMGLAEINGSSENVNGHVYAGYSNYTMRITYAAAINSDTSFIYGDNGNDNKVVLTWKRTSSEYYDTLIDDAHVFSFGIDLAKVFSDKDSAAADKEGLFQKVQFIVQNDTDGYYLKAALNQAEGVYYVTGHTAKKSEATVFTPVTYNGKPGQIMIKGCEDDTYIISEIKTANGYSLLKNKIKLVISAAADTARPCNIYAQDTLGVLQNDPHYSFNGDLDLKLANIPQKALAHTMMTAKATVDGNPVTMLADKDSNNAEAPLKVVNTPGFDLPQTGDTGTWMFGACGLILMACSGIAVLLLSKSKKSRR